MLKKLLNVLNNKQCLYFSSHIHLW